MTKKSILIVDDNEFFLEQGASCLNSEQFKILRARSGREALEKVRTLKPELILMDTVMPDLSGRQVCNILKEDPSTSSIPIIIATSGRDENTGMKRGIARCDGIIFKPIRRDQLIAMVEELLKIQVRKWVRRKVRLPCKVTIFLEGEEGEGIIRTLGGGGAFFEYLAPLFTGDMCRIKFTLPETQREIMVWSAVVVWTGKLDEDGSEGSGVRFLTIDKEDQVEIDRFSTLGQNEKSQLHSPKEAAGK